MSRENKKAQRPKRKGGAPLGVYHSKMTVPDGLIPDDRVGRWINDKDNRITLALGSDWEFVKKGGHIGGGDNDKNSDIGDKVSMVVGTDATGEPMRAYLMMKDRDWHEDDQAIKGERNDAIDQAIRTPGFKADETGVDKSGLSGSIKYKA